MPMNQHATGASVQLDTQLPHVSLELGNISRYAPNAEVIYHDKRTGQLHPVEARVVIKHPDVRNLEFPELLGKQETHVARSQRFPQSEPQPIMRRYHEPHLVGVLTAAAQEAIGDENFKVVEIKHLPFEFIHGYRTDTEIWGQLHTGPCTLSYYLSQTGNTLPDGSLLGHLPHHYPVLVEVKPRHMDGRPANPYVGETVKWNMQVFEVERGEGLHGMLQREARSRVDAERIQADFFTAIARHLAKIMNPSTMDMEEFSLLPVGMGDGIEVRVTSSRDGKPKVWTTHNAQY